LTLASATLTRDSFSSYSSRVIVFELSSFSARANCWRENSSWLSWLAISAATSAADSSASAILAFDFASSASSSAVSIRTIT
jgi:hypothetical protein